MKKTILSIFVLLFALSQTTELKAQSTFTADLELIFRDTTRHFVLNYGDTTQVNFAVVNHGPDDIDTSSYVLYSMTTIPSNYFLVVQTENGGLPLIPNGDTVDSHQGVIFTHEEFDVDTTFGYCYFLRTNEDADSFIYDPNQANDTICFYITYKKAPVNSINQVAGRQHLKIAPNPASDFVNVPINDMQNQEVLVKAYSIDGRVVHEQKITNNQERNLRLNIANWPKGMYIVDLQSEKGIRTGRFVVQ